MANVYVIRADGNSKIGAGHLMRCLTIARKLKTMIDKEDCIRFFCAREEGAKLVEEQGFEAEVLYTDYSDMCQEIPVFEEKINRYTDRGLSVKWILVDSYFVNDVYLTALKHFGRVALMDDMAQTAYGMVDLIINYNLYAQKEHYDALYGTQNSVHFLLGASYVPIREQFERPVKEINGDVKRLLITTGGADQDNIGGAILERLSKEYKEIHFDLVAGKFHPQIQKLRDLERQNDNISIHQNVQDMASLMLQSDLCVTAGGTTIYELAVLGIPFVCFSYAQNQEQLVEYIGKYDIAAYAGAWHKDAKQAMTQICDLVFCLCKEGKIRKSYSQKEHTVVDGEGAIRIAKVLTE